MMHVIRVLAALLVGAVVIGALGWGVAIRISDAMRETEREERSTAVAVEVVEPESGPIRDTRRFTGTLRARSQVDVAPRISGRISRLMVDIGDIVERGDLIAQLDDDELIQDVEQARADLLVARATLEERTSAAGIAERDYDRTVRLREQRIASESELDAARSRYESERAVVRVAEADVARREAALRSAEVRLSYATIRAAWDTTAQSGASAAVSQRIVGERYVDEGATVAANAPIVSLLDLDRVLAIVYVTERDYAAMRRGLSATVAAQHNSAGRQHSGQIVRMAPAFAEGSRQARVEIEVPNEDHQLKPGMFVTVSLELGRDDNAVMVPRQALLQRDGVQGVFVIDVNTMQASFTPIEIGIRDRERVQIVEPKLGGPVVVLGQHLLSDGASVSLADDQDEGDA